MLGTLWRDCLQGGMVWDPNQLYYVIGKWLFTRQMRKQVLTSRELKLANVPNCRVVADIPAHQDAKIDVLEKQPKEAAVMLDAERQKSAVLSYGH